MTRWLLPLCLLGSSLLHAQTPKLSLENVPAHLIDRCTPEKRLAQIEKFRGDPLTEEAVLKSLRFLKDTQNPDGSWLEKTEQHVGMTGLALLCFLGHGESAQSNEFGVHVLNAITFLVDIAMKNNGRLASDFNNDHWCYEHAIASTALCEAYSLCSKGLGEEIPNLEEMAQKSAQFIINNQHVKGGWDYGYAKDSRRGGDVSITCWHLQAHYAAKRTGLAFKNHDKCTKLALEYIERNQLPSGAIGYSSPSLHGDGTTLAAAGAASYQFHRQPEKLVTRKANAFIAKNMKFNWDTADSDLYGHYYASMALRNVAGNPWLKYQAMVYPQILANQKEDGSFNVLNSGGKINAVAASFQGESEFAILYRTCLVTLILETYYRHPWIPSKI